MMVVGAFGAFAQVAAIFSLMAAASGIAFRHAVKIAAPVEEAAPVGAGEGGEAEAVDGRVRGAGGGTDRVAGALEAERAVLREDVALFASGHPGDAVVVRVI